MHFCWMTWTQQLELSRQPRSLTIQGYLYTSLHDIGHLSKKTKIYEDKALNFITQKKYHQPAHAAVARRLRAFRCETCRTLSTKIDRQWTIFSNLLQSIVQMWKWKLGRLMSIPSEALPAFVSWMSLQEVYGKTLSVDLLCHFFGYIIIASNLSVVYVHVYISIYISTSLDVCFHVFVFLQGGWWGQSLEILFVCLFPFQTHVKRLEIYTDPPFYGPQLETTKVLSTCGFDILRLALLQQQPGAELCGLMGFGRKQI